MLRSLRVLATIGMAMTLLSTTSAAQVTLPHREHCNGTVTAAVSGKLFFKGQGVATHFGRYIIEGSNDFDVLGNISNGVFTTTSSDGSTISGIYSGTSVVLPSGKIRFDVSATWLGGTGRFEGVTGRGEVVAILDGVTPGAAFEYNTLGFLLVP